MRRILRGAFNIPSSFSFEDLEDGSLDDLEQQKLDRLENKIKRYKEFEEQIKEQRILTRQCWWFVFDLPEPQVWLLTPEYVDLYGYLKKKEEKFTVAPELYQKVFDIVRFFHDTLQYAILDIKLDAFVLEPIQDLDSAPVGSSTTCRVLLLDEDKAVPLNSREQVVPRPMYDSAFEIRDPKIRKFDETAPHDLDDVSEEASPPRYSGHVQVFRLLAPARKPFLHVFSTFLG